MGTRIPVPTPDPDPVPPGLDCVNCWGSGKPFGDGDTPSVILVSISGVIKGPTWSPGDGEPINGDFVIPQFAIGCFYRFVGIGVLLQLIFGAAGTVFTATNASAEVTFSADVGTACLTGFTNEKTGNFIGGSAVLTIPPTT